MADPMFPYEPEVDYTPNPSPEIKTELMNRWTSWLDAPENRAALMQFGVNLMQPMGVGQSPAGHIGQAIGAGAEAQDRNIASQNEEQQRSIKNTEVQQELGLRARGVAADETRAQAYKTGMETKPTLQADRQDASRGKSFADWLSTQTEPLAREALKGDTVAIEAMRKRYDQIVGTAEETETPSGTGDVGHFPNAKLDTQTGRHYIVQGDKVIFVD